MGKGPDQNERERERELLFGPPPLRPAKTRAHSCHLALALRPA